MSGESSTTKDTTTNSATNYDTSSLESMLTGTSGSTTGWADAMSSISKLMPGLTTAAVSSTSQTPAQTSAYDTLMNNAQNSTSYSDYAGQAQKLANDLLSGTSHGAGKLINSGFSNYSNSTGQNSSALDSAFNNYTNSTNSNSALMDRAYSSLVGSTGQNAGMLKNAYGNLQQTLNPYTDANYLDPTKTPGMQSVLQTIQQDIGNSVNSQFAGAGRDMSGMNLQALARGVSQGMAVPLLNQYNQNVAAQQGAAGTLYGAGSNTASGLQGFANNLYDAGNTTALNKQGLGSSLYGAANATALGKQGLASSLYDASNTTASGLNNLLQQDYARRATGLDIGMNTVPAAQNAQANAVLDAANTQQSAAASQYAPYLSLLSSLAGLGQESSSVSAGQGTTTGTGSSTSTGTSSEKGTSNLSEFAKIMAVLNTGSNMFGNVAKATASDRRVKDDIAQIGELYDGTPIYRFRYKGDPRVSVGLMADDVERYAPEAVVEVAGVKMVDYGAATERAAEMGAK